jgi:hypothetical protein
VALGALAQAVTGPAPDPGLVAQARESVGRILARETEIRSFIDGTKNLGHQSASIDLLKRALDITGF